MAGVQKSSRKVRRSAVVVIATDGSPVDGLDMLDQCRQVWGYGTGITVPLVGNSVFHLVSTNTQDTDNRVNVALLSRPKHTTQTNATYDPTLNVSCILVSKDKSNELFFTAPRVPVQPHTTSTANKFQTDLADGLTSLSSATDELYSTSSGASDQSIAPPVQDNMYTHVPMSLVGPVVVVLILSAIAYRALKIKVLQKSHTGPAIGFPALRRSASLPVVRRYTNRTVEEDTASCKSLPAVLLSNDPSYSEIPDNVAAAQRPLPAIPQIYSVIPDAATAVSEQPSDLSSQPHTYCHIPDNDGIGHIPFYAAAADASLGSDTAYGVGSEGNQAFCSRHSIAVRKTAVYNSVETRDHHTSLYGKARNIGTQQSKQAQGPKRILNSTPRCLTVPKTLLPREISGEGPRDTTRRASVPITPQNTFWPCEFPGKGVRNTPRRASLPLTTQMCSLTFWAYDIPGEGTRNTPRPVSFPLTLPNACGPCEITGEGGTGSNNQHASLTNPPNTCSCTIPSKGTINMPLRACLSELPNTYWPWEIPEKGTRSTTRRTSLPIVTLPNTYWPWEIPEKGTRNTTRRKSLPPVTLPNTYCPWEIPEKETRNTPRRKSLPPVTLPNTYWPWEISEKETRNTARRESLPIVTLPNTYWPWEITENSRDTPRRATSLSQLPNTYWPWEILGDGTSGKPGRASLSIPKV
uniref:Uncharacterized protein n=1 Tax=Branchiostoma floridae TaxID=7739 RepID=C3YCC7_BRAFL|eukprot:XP_002605954.1 hypothetical protein BRAFLDRAFT_92218 [Branchiostoma floridae]